MALEIYHGKGKNDKFPTFPIAHEKLAGLGRAEVAGRGPRLALSRCTLQARHAHDSWAYLRS